MKNKDQKSTNVYEINTTAWDEENFYLLTTLTEKQVIKVIKPIVSKERRSNSDEYFYDNETLVSTLIEKYPDEVVEFYQSFETITI